MSDKPEPRVDADGVPRCQPACGLYVCNVHECDCAIVCKDEVCPPAVRAMARELREAESRALAAEGRLRTVERMFQDVGSYRDFSAALDAWAAAHKEEA